MKTTTTKSDQLLLDLWRLMVARANSTGEEYDRHTRDWEAKWLEAAAYLSQLPERRGDSRD